MENTNDKTKNWQADAQDKKDPLTRSCTRQVKDSNGAKPSSSGNGIATTEISDGEPQGLRPEDPGPPQTSTAMKNRRKINRRGLKSSTWTVEQKKVLLYCYHYSMFEKWSRTSNQILRIVVWDKEKGAATLI